MGLGCGRSGYSRRFLYLHRPLKLASVFQRGILILFCSAVTDSLLAVTALDVSAVLLHLLQVFRIPHVAGATSNISITDLPFFLPRSCVTPVMSRTPLLIRVNDMMIMRMQILGTGY